jgi:hypothetical protein
MEIKNIEGLKVSQIKQLVNQGGKFVVFPYTISIVVMTFRRSSSIYFIRPNENSIKYSYGHVGVNLLLGWWGIPWGPIYTLGAAYNHVTGGKDVTQPIMSHLIQHDPEADTTTYGINDMVNPSSQNETAEAPSSYNIPR